MAILSAAQVRQLASNAGFRGAALETIVGIAGAESADNTQAKNWNPPRNGQPGSWDLGILQINQRAWPSFFSGSNWTDPQAEFNYAYNVISQHGQTFGAWATYNNGSWASFVNPGQIGNAAGNLVGGIPGPGGVGNLGQIGSAVGGAGNLLTNPTGAAEQAVADVSKWALPHIILVGGAAVALFMFLEHITRGAPVPEVPV